jgi:phosphoribosyl-AMP cyclohydrolase
VSASQSAAPPVALSTGLDPLIAARLKRDAAGLVPAVVQQYDTGAVLMLAWMNDAALARTLASGQATYWSRSRQSLWVKGETSGNRQAVRSVALDCDGDTLLVRVDQIGPACHTGTPTCFEDVLRADPADLADPADPAELRPDPADRAKETR